MIWLLVSVTIAQASFDEGYFPVRVCHYASEDLQSKTKYMIPPNLTCPLRLRTSDIPA